MKIGKGIDKNFSLMPCGHLWPLAISTVRGASLKKMAENVITIIYIDCCKLYICCGLKCAISLQGKIASLKAKTNLKIQESEPKINKC